MQVISEVSGVNDLWPPFHSTYAPASSFQNVTFPSSESRTVVLNLGVNYPSRSNWEYFRGNELVSCTLLIKSIISKKNIYFNNILLLFLQRWCSMSYAVNSVHCSTTLPDLRKHVQPCYRSAPIKPLANPMKDQFQCSLGSEI